ncbi:flavodoxin family protein [Clostridium sp. JNZ X4-2]
MEVLGLNGSPKGEKSNTFRITRAFLEGLEESRNCNVHIVNTSEKNIEHCRGCFVCWTKTPGKCVIKDDMKELVERYVTSDVVIWSFPLYYFGMPSKIKAFLHRMLPTNLPYMNINKDGTSAHPSRYELSNQRYILISTCGFYSTKNNYDALFNEITLMGSSGDRVKNSASSDFWYMYRLERLKNIPKYITVIPYKMNYNDNSTSTQPIYKNLDGVYPIELKQRNMGEIVINKIELKKDRTIVRYSAKGKAPFLQARELYILDDKNNEVERKDDSVNVKRDGNNPDSYVLEFVPLSKDKKYKIGTNDLGLYDVRNDLKFKIQLVDK